MARKSPTDSHPLTNTQQKILALFSKNPRARLTPIEIHRRAGFPGDDLQHVADSLRALCRQGRIVEEFAPDEATEEKIMYAAVH